MTRYTKSTRKFQEVSCLPLFNFRHAVVVQALPTTRAGLMLARRFQLAPATADLIGELAFGLNREASR